MSRRPRRGDIVEILWRDSVRVTLGWASTADYLAALHEKRPPSERTAGYWIGRDRSSVMIALNLSPASDAEVADAMVIPRAAIAQITVLGRARRRTRRFLRP